MRSAEQCPTFDVIESKADIETTLNSRCGGRNLRRRRWAVEEWNGVVQLVSELRAYTA